MNHAIVLNALYAWVLAVGTGFGWDWRRACVGRPLRVGVELQTNAWGSGVPVHLNIPGHAEVYLAVTPAFYENSHLIKSFDFHACLL